MHHTNSTLPQVFVSLHCNSRGTRTTQSLPLPCWKISLPRQKNCKGVLLCMDLPRWGKSVLTQICSHPRQRPKFLQIQNISFQRVLGISKGVVREEETKGLELSKRPRKKMAKLQNTKIQYCGATSLSHDLRDAFFFFFEVFHNICNLKNVEFQEFEVLKFVLLKMLTKLREKISYFSPKCLVFSAT